ncbi:hypothetical protein [Spirillospora sp. NPDC047279]|uniref:hypothetical protein n=1 Tax=Spirillospora sp. NPDC047279 TaxID=3155478 RepID=UPI0033F7CA9B
MPSIKHEALALLVRENPELARHFCTQLGVPVPANSRPRLTSEDATQVHQLTMDRTVFFVDEDDKTTFAVVYEVQLKFKPEKHKTWPMYLAQTRFRHDCPAVLIVICPTTTAAKACAAPIDLGHPGLVLRPLVIGPDSIPKITTVEEALDNIELAVQSCLAHGDGEDGAAILEVVTEALDAVDGDKAKLYLDLLTATLGESGKLWLEEFLVSAQYEYASDYVRGVREVGREEGREEGKVLGEARMLLVALAGRGIEVDAKSEARIRECEDTGQLEQWMRRALVIDQVEDLFSE